MQARIDAAPSVALDLDAELAKAFTPKSLNGKPADSKKGDFDRAFAGAKTKVEATYATPDEHHNPMEMHATQATWRGDDKVTIYDATQGITTPRRRSRRCSISSPTMCASYRTTWAAASAAKAPRGRTSRWR